MLYAVALEFRGPVACRWIQWLLGLVFAANVTALARPSLGRRAWWAGRDGAARAGGHQRHDRAAQRRGPGRVRRRPRSWPGPGSMIVRAIAAATLAGMFAGLAMGVKYPALVLLGLARRARRSCGPGWTGPGGRGAAWSLLASASALRSSARRRSSAGAGISGLTCTPAIRSIPFFRHWFGGAGLDEVLAPIKRPLAGDPLEPARRRSCR